MFVATSYRVYGNLDATHDALTREVLEQASQNETDAPKPCPKCGKPVAVRVCGRERQIRTRSGVQTLQRIQSRL